MTPAFEKFVKNPWPGRLITFDPGQTTGWSIWDNSQLTDTGQLATFPVSDAVGIMTQWFDAHALTRMWDVMVAIEEYRVYEWKAQDHAQSTLHTARFIGCLETLLVQRGIPYATQGAGIAKPFATDQKLKDWGFYERGARHARDAIRHGAYFLCHGKPPV